MRGVCYTNRMEIRLSPEKEAQLHQLASSTGREPGAVIEEAVDLLLNHDAWFIAQVEHSLNQADQGQLIDHEDVVSRIERRIQGKQPRS